MARINQVVAFTQNDDGTQTYRVGAQSVTFNPDKVSAANRVYAELHGWKQRLSDATALSRDPKTGRSATPEEKFAALVARVNHYESGAESWDMPRTGGGGGRSESSYILQAAANVQDVDLKTMSERVATNAEKRGVTVDAYLRQLAKTSEAVRTEIANIKYGEAEGADDMLDELGGADADETIEE